jgi:hypothetical protein
MKGQTCCAVCSVIEEFTVLSRCHINKALSALSNCISALTRLTQKVAPLSKVFFRLQESTQYMLTSLLTNCILGSCSVSRLGANMAS